MSDLAVHTMRPARMLEWIGLTIVKRYLSTSTSDKVEDVHSDPAYFQKGIDLILHGPSGLATTIDLKVDSYFGSDPNRKVRGLCNPDSGFILLETISQLRFDRERWSNVQGTLPARNRPDVPGWFFTSTADQVYYYFVAILNDGAELRPLHNEWTKKVTSGSGADLIENQLLRMLRIDQDLLISYELDKARSWFEAAPESAFGGFGAAVNPAYVTVNKRALRERFVSEVPAKNHGSLFSKIADAQL